MVNKFFELVHLGLAIQDLRHAAEDPEGVQFHMVSSDPSGTKMILFSIPFESYAKRVTSLIIDWGTFLLLAVIAVSFIFVSKYVGSAVVIFALYYIKQILKEARLYIVEIIKNNENFELHYFWKNDGPHKVTIPVDSLAVQRFDSVKGNITASRIVIKGNYSEFIQYSVGLWDKDTLNTVYAKVTSV